jgi:hypothetical protein
MQMHNSPKIIKINFSSLRIKLLKIDNSTNTFEWLKMKVLMQIENSTKIGKLNFEWLKMKVLMQIDNSTKNGKIKLS